MNKMREMGVNESKNNIMQNKIIDKNISSYDGDGSNVFQKMTIFITIFF